MNPHTERTRVLLQLRRYAEAEKEVRQALAIEPNASTLHAWLAVCLLERNAPLEAEAAVRQAIGADPENAFAHYTAGRVANRLGQESRALSAIREALRLAPYDPDYHYYLAAVHFDRQRWPEALSSVDEGLRCGPQHVACANLRALCLVRLGKPAAAISTIDRALADDPEYAWSHETRGSLALQAGEAEKAFTHYREALRLNPQSEVARNGLIQSLKSRHGLYRFLFWLFDWSDERHGYHRLAVALVAVVLLALVLGRSQEPMGAILAAMFIVTGGVFAARVFFRYYAEPFFLCLLRFDELGRRALSADEVRQANLAVGSLAATVGLLVTGIVLRMPLCGLLAVAAILSPFPLNFIFRQPPSGPRLWATFDYLFFTLWTAFLLAVAVGIPIVGFIWMIHGVAAGHRVIVRRADFRRAVTEAKSTT